MGQFRNTVNWAQIYIKDAIKDISYISAVIVGISLILLLLRNLAILDKANRQRFIYIISQIGYYTEIESLLLPKDIKSSLRADLITKVIDLYKLIIEFQIQSVIRFYQNSTKNYFRNVIDYNGWNNQLGYLKEKKTSLVQKFDIVFANSSLEQLKKLAKDTEG